MARCSALWWKRQAQRGVTGTSYHSVLGQPNDPTGSKAASAGASCCGSPIALWSEAWQRQRKTLGTRAGGASAKARHFGCCSGHSASLSWGARVCHGLFRAEAKAQ